MPPNRVEPVAVQSGEGSADRGLARATPGRDAEGDQDARLGVGDPLTDRGERPGSGQDRGQRDRQQTREPVTDPAASPRIADLLEELEQTRARQRDRLEGRAATGEDDMAGVVLRSGRLCENFHPHLKHHARTRPHPACHTTNPQVTAPPVRPCRGPGPSRDAPTMSTFSADDFAIGWMQASLAPTCGYGAVVSVCDRPQLSASSIR